MTQALALCMLKPLHLAHVPVGVSRPDAATTGAVPWLSDSNQRQQQMMSCMLVTPMSQTDAADCTWAVQASQWTLSQCCLA
jgi:hypothetical protein